ncbi:MAG: alpha/beta hydrolase [Deltaproteobacteria bacterium]|nr:alpha/beta hydrolase [Deltaproteobacteria bacterium]
MRVLNGTIDIHVDEAADLGDGEPVVMIHSSGMSSRQWRGLARVLSSTHRAVAPDLLGYGGTGGWNGSENFELAEDLAVVVSVARALDRSVHLVGHSYGGMLALNAARALGADRVRSIAAYEPVAWGVARPDPLVRADLAQFGDRFFTPEYGGTSDWYRQFVDYWNGPGTWDAMPPEQRDAFLAVGRKVSAEVRRLCFDPTPADAYREIAAPTLILSGARSPAAERRVCEILVETMPRAELVTIAGAGHMGPLTHADEVNRRIAAHVRASV